MLREDMRIRKELPYIVSSKDTNDFPSAVQLDEQALVKILKTQPLAIDAALKKINPTLFSSGCA